MEELLLAMMNRGYYVYISPSQRFCVRKEPMCNDPGEIFCADFGSLEEALAWVKKEIGFESDQEKQAKCKALANVLWDLQLMYKHRAFKQPRFESLGQVSNCDHQAAVESGRKLAALWIEQNFEERDVEHWEVKARPAHTKT